MRGPGALTNAELIAILLRTGQKGENVVRVAERVLAQAGGLDGLGRAGFAELAGLSAMGEAKACQLLAALELGRRVLNARPPEARRIRCPEDIHAMLFAEMALLEQEELKVLLLNTRNEVKGLRVVYRGNVSAAIVRSAEVFRDAIRESCPSIALAHNHPSGDPSPSAEDVLLTKQLREAGKMLGIDVVDHVVIARSGFVSMKDRRLGFE
jgi:DNA repair protein RadC